MKHGATNNECLEQAEAVFKRAKQYLELGPIFRFVSYLYAERKMLVFLAVHVVVTISVWGT